MGGRYFYVSWHPRRCYVKLQRVHHGPVALASGTALWFLPEPLRYLAWALWMWGLTDWRDLPYWFRRDLLNLQTIQDRPRNKRSGHSRSNPLLIQLLHRRQRNPGSLRSGIGIFS